MKIVITESQLKNIIIKENENHYIGEQDDWDPENYYTKEEDEALMNRIKTTSANYTSARLYSRDYPELYRQIGIRGLMDQIFPKKETVKKQEGKKPIRYTKEEKLEMLKKAKKLAVNYKNPRQFGLDHLNLYNYLRKAGLLDKVFPYRRKNSEYGGWTEDKIRQLAKGYMRASDFERDHPVAYNKALTLGITNDLFPKNNTNTFSSPDFDLANSNDEKYQKHIDDLTDVAGNYENMSDMKKRNPSLFKQMSKFGHDDRPISDEDDDDHFMADFIDDDYDDYTYGGGGSLGIEPVPDPAGPKTYKPQDLTGVDTFKKPRLRKASEQPGYEPLPPREKPQVAPPVKKSVVNPEQENLRNEYQKLSRELSSAKNRLANAKALYNSEDMNPNQRNVMGFYMKQDEDKIEQLTGMINSIKSEMSMKGLKY
jgi:hypothetical protein